MKPRYFLQANRDTTSCKFCVRKSLFPSGTPDIGKYCNRCRMSRRELAIKYFGGGSVTDSEMTQDYIVRRVKDIAEKND